MEQARERFSSPMRNLVGFSLDREELAEMEALVAWGKLGGPMTTTDPVREPERVAPPPRPHWIQEITQAVLEKHRGQLADPALRPLKLVDNRITCPSCGDYQTSLVADSDVHETWRCDSMRPPPRGELLELCGHTWTIRKLPIGGVAVLAFWSGKPDWRGGAATSTPPGFLVELRTDMGTGPLWLFPAGKIKGDETPARTLLRECQEELRMIPVDARPLTPIRQPIAPAGAVPTYTLQPYLVTKWDRSLLAMPDRTDAGDRLKWMMVDELERHPRAAIRDMVREAMSVIRNLERGL